MESTDFMLNGLIFGHKAVLSFQLSLDSMTIYFNLQWSHSLYKIPLMKFLVTHKTATQKVCCEHFIVILSKQEQIELAFNATDDERKLT